MEDVFKEQITSYAVTYCFDFYPECFEQINKLNLVWDRMFITLDRDEFYVHFIMLCALLNFDIDQFDMHAAFQKVETEWRIELMIKVANEIVQLNTKMYDTKLVDYNVKTKKLQFTLSRSQLSPAACSSYAE